MAAVAQVVKQTLQKVTGWIPSPCGVHVAVYLSKMLNSEHFSRCSGMGDKWQIKVSSSVEVPSGHMNHRLITSLKSAVKVHSRSVSVFSIGLHATGKLWSEGGGPVWRLCSAQPDQLLWLLPLCRSELRERGKQRSYCLNQALNTNYSVWQLVNF